MTEIIVKPEYHDWNGYMKTDRFYLWARIALESGTIKSVTPTWSYCEEAAFLPSGLCETIILPVMTTPLPFNWQYDRTTIRYIAPLTKKEPIQIAVGLTAYPVQITEFDNDGIVSSKTAYLQFPTHNNSHE